MPKQYYAHSLSGKPPSEWQPLEAHLKNVAELASGFADVFEAVNPFLAEKTGFDEKDLEILCEALLNAFQFDQSAVRPAGSKAARKLIIFKHENALGNVPSHVLFERVRISRVEDAKPARDYSDYTVDLDDTKLPADISIMKKP